ncbi:unnamed protein product [Angiostrongylus costaricensis]|uniref:Stromal cell-derived factor 4 n=1 Tax=Angiostrongylus costaricensis TaxID=334426 RepID=A0A0R3PYB0_ANGCS|nr:unnamed protein product [Angiostrongylus costaricensis]
MRVLLSLVLIRSVISVPMSEHETNRFDPRKPIQGAFFVSGNTDPLNIAKFRFPQKALIMNRGMFSFSPYNSAASTDATTTIAALAVAPSAPEPAAPALALADVLAPPLHSQLARKPVQGDMTVMRTPDVLLPEQHATNLISPYASALDEQQLITTTQTIPTISVVEQKTVSTITTSQPLPVASNMMPVDKNVDLDGDGRLSLPEVQYAAFVHHGLSGSVVQGLFSEVDRNKDGFLDSAEFDNIRPLVLAKAENAALRYMQSVDTDKNKMLSLEEAQAYILKEHGIGFRDVERVWRLVVPRTSAEMDALQFSKLRRRIRGMTIRLARQIMKNADTNGDGHISLEEAQAIAFEQEGIGAGDVAQMFASVDDNNDGELNAPEFADFERIVRSKADLAPFFAQADENEDGHLDAVEFAGFRSVIRNKAVRNAIEVLKEIDLDGDGLVSLSEAEAKTKREDDMDTPETAVLFNIADQGRSMHF